MQYKKREIKDLENKKSLSKVSVRGEPYKNQRTENRVTVDQKDN